VMVKLIIQIKNIITHTKENTTKNTGYRNNKMLVFW
jgi:hypothetical protein